MACLGCSCWAAVVGCSKIAEAEAAVVGGGLESCGEQGRDCQSDVCCTTVDVDVSVEM